MLIKIYAILLVYFLLGALGIVFINRKEQEKAAKRERWVKYFVYLLLVNLVITTIDLGYFLYLSIVISLFGFYEIIRIGYKNLSLLIPSIILFIFICSFFILASRYPAEYLLYFYLTILTFDGFSQISGQLFGKTKLSPTISPNKTNEGFLGGVLGVLFTLIILIENSYTNISVVFTLVVISLVIGGTALSGDLLASYYKRINNVKDYSNLIPGHGGVLDRFDSFIFSVGFYSFLQFIIFEYVFL